VEENGKRKQEAGGEREREGERESPNDRTQGFNGRWRESLAGAVWRKNKIKRDMPLK